MLGGFLCNLRPWWLDWVPRRLSTWDGMLLGVQYSAQLPTSGPTLTRLLQAYSQGRYAFGLRGHFGSFQAVCTDVKLPKLQYGTFVKKEPSPAYLQTRDCPF